MADQHTIGIPKEVKNNENRVAMTPAGVQSLVGAGHKVLVEKGAGVGSSFPDEEYREAGAEIIADAETVWRHSTIILKVKEPQKEEFAFFHDGLILFTYLHLAAEPALTRVLVEKNVTAIAYETIQLDNGSLPLLSPMSEVAGRMSVQIGAHFLEKAAGGKGVLLGGVPGVKPANVVIIGGGMVGTNAAKMALGLGANVTILDVNPERLRQLEDILTGRFQLVMSNSTHIAEAVKTADLLIGAVLIPGSRAPILVTEQMVKSMTPGSVIVDVAVDQGGSIETIDRVTTHNDPIYEKHGVIHYAVANMPGAVPRTSTLALANVTLPYVNLLATKGLDSALQENKPLRKGVNVYRGQVTYEAVATALGETFVPLSQLIPFD